MTLDPLSHVASWITPATPDVAPTMPGDDGKIVSLFREWQATERAAAAMPEADDNSPEKAAREAALDHADDILADIAGVPAAGMTGFVIKAYLQLHSERGCAFGDDDPCSVRGFSEDTDGCSSAALLGQSLLADMGRLVPDLAPLVELAISDEDTPMARLARTLDEIARLRRNRPDEPEGIGFDEPEEPR